MILFGHRRDIDLTRACPDNWPPRHRRELSHQNRRASGLFKRLRRRDTPGVILGDEVGKGKTYIALAVAAAFLNARRKARVLVLTHSRRMARTWLSRWENEVRKCVRNRKLLRNGEWRWQARHVHSYKDFESKVGEDNKVSTVWFASYDAIKRYHSDEEKKSWTAGILRWAYAAHRIRLDSSTKRALIKEIVPGRYRLLPDPNFVSESEGVRILKRTFDRKERWWRNDELRWLRQKLDELEGRETNLGRSFDLLIVDEAHKMEGRARHGVITRLLHKKFSKGIWVTATPFALTLDEFKRRLGDFRHAKSAPKHYDTQLDRLALNAYRRAIEYRETFDRRKELETGLQLRLIRSTWNHGLERKSLDWTVKPSSDTLLPTFLLERVLAELLGSGQRTHVASRRKSLCSSWADALRAVDEDAWRRDREMRRWVDALSHLLKKRRDSDPKMAHVVDKLADHAQRGEKTVVFTERLATSKALVKSLRTHPQIQQLKSKFERAADRWPHHQQKIARACGVSVSDARIVAKLLAHTLDAPRSSDMEGIRRWWRRHLRRLRGLEYCDAAQEEGAHGALIEHLRRAIGPRKHLPLVARYDGETGRDDGASQDPATLEKFNLPCSPLILIASSRAQEGVDLHHYCRRVVLYDLPWNPAIIEQRIGRVHRLGGIRGANKPVEVIYCYQKGTYEDNIAQRVKQRAQMMHALLAAR